MAQSKVFVNKFMGIINSVDASIIGLQGTVDLENYSLVNGILQPVEGTTKIGTGATFNQTGILGLNYIRGFNTSNVQSEKFIVFASTPNTIQATLYDASGASPSFSTSNLSFSTAPTYSSTNEWQTIIYDNTLLASNKNEVYTLDWGNSTQFQIASRFDPVIGIPSNIGIAYSSGVPQGVAWAGFTTTTNNTSYDTSAGIQRIAWTSSSTGIGTTSKIKPTDWWYNNSSVGTDAQQHVYYNDSTNKIVLRFGHRAYNNDTSNAYVASFTAQTRTPEDFQIVLWSNDLSEPWKGYLKNQLYRDFLYLNFQVSKSYSANWTEDKYKTVFDPTKFVLTYEDANGNTFTPSVKCQKITNGQNLDQYVVCGDSSAKYKFGTSAFDWSNVSKITINGNLTWATFQSNTLADTFGAPVTYAYFFDLSVGELGGVNLKLAPSDSTGVSAIQFATVRYTPSTGEITQPHNIQTFTLSDDALSGAYYRKGAYTWSELPREGKWLTVKYPIGGTSSTETWLVVNDQGNPNAWRKIGFTTNPGVGLAQSSTAFYAYNSNDMPFLPDISTSRSYISNANCMCTFQGWVVYGINRVTDNIRHSYTGNPIELASTTISDSLDIGGDYTMSESYSDIPIAMTSIFDTLYIFGTEGAYCQTGSVASQLTPVRKIASLPGICGQFAHCKINDAQLGQGVIYVSRDASRAYFLYADARYNNVTYRAIEITENIRDTFKSYLTETQSDISKIRVAYRPDDDSIYIVNGRNAWIWTRSDLLTNKRQIIKRKLSDADLKFNFLSFPINSAGVVLPVFASTGIGTTQSLLKFDATNYKDHNTAIQSRYISGELYNTNNIRMANIWVDRKPNNSPVGVMVTSTRQTWSGSISTSTSNLPVNFKTQGYKHQIQFTQTNSSTSSIQNYWVEFTGNVASRPEHSNI